ncbi:hypothetical protein HOT14_gp25 [Escherichia phage vB_EcoS_IME347]|uniref:Uncharacterized protein n=1 Tax=Escherichia phage vB_EcoS_IME347 TaxID=2496546 RepID=A0A2S1GS47_9CAUD|nr:hypothetical protein HOT14_gp25 [Escherichia phage vB_EcoS_IME347]AWD92225.1 hypothetical protein [Escherichia phage vB_EcoS_IME347]
MIKFIHTFKVSSGKERKEIVKVYGSPVKAKEQLRLLGGRIDVVKHVEFWSK